MDLIKDYQYQKRILDYTPIPIRDQKQIISFCQKAHQRQSLKRGIFKFYSWRDGGLYNFTSDIILQHGLHYTNVAKVEWKKTLGKSTFYQICNSLYEESLPINKWTTYKTVFRGREIERKSFNLSGLDHFTIKIEKGVFEIIRVEKRIHSEEKPSCDWSYEPKILGEGKVKKISRDSSSIFVE